MMPGAIALAIIVIASVVYVGVKLGLRP